MVHSETAIAVINILLSSGYRQQHTWKSELISQVLYRYL